jgi:hypothetical protein
VFALNFRPSSTADGSSCATVEGTASVGNSECTVPSMAVKNDHVALPGRSCGSEPETVAV